MARPETVEIPLDFARWLAQSLHALAGEPLGADYSNCEHAAICDAGDETDEYVKSAFLFDAKKLDELLAPFIEAERR